MGDINDDALEEERKTLVNMVGKICIISNSSREKLQTVTDLATEAMDAKIATDTTTRNALNKIHQALCNALGEADSVGRSAEGPNANETVAGHRLGTEDISDVEGTLLKLEEKRTVTPAQDALVDELLLDENEDL